VIAGLDLRAPGRRAAAVRELSVLPQVLDHLAFGAAVAIYLRFSGSQVALRRVR
jgi:hypothetical protein